MNVQSIYHQSALRMEEELRLVKQAQNDPRHFGQLYKMYYQQIFRYIYQKIDDSELACDITSQVFMKALTNIKKFEYRGVPFSSWLYRIAKSEVYQSFRDRKVEMKLTASQIHNNISEEDSEEEVLNNRKIALIQAMSLLKNQELRLIELRFFEKKSFKEIAEMEQITENNAKVKTFRALEKLRIIFKKNTNTTLHFKC